MDDPRRRPALKAWQRRILVRLAACIVPETATAFISSTSTTTRTSIDEIKQFRRERAAGTRSACSPSAPSLQPFGIKLVA